MPDETAPAAQVWELTVDGRRHRVETRGSVTRRVRWYLDDDLVAETKSTEDKIRISAADRPELGVIGVRFSGLGKPRRATLFEPDTSSEPDASARAIAGVGGLDLLPEKGSGAAAYEDRVRAHPRRYALIQTLIGVAKVVVPIIVATVLARLAFSVPWPNWDLPRIPWPDLPDLPRPDLPGVPLPEWSLPDVSLPGWLRWLLDHAKFVWPVVLAYVLARAEINRRKKQDELRAERAGQRRDEE